MIKKVIISKTIKSFILILSCIIIIYSCSEENEIKDNYFDNLNGYWIGDYQIKQIGDCRLLGDLIRNTLLKVEITDVGVVEIIEYFYVDSLDTYYYVDSSKYEWKGTINKAYEYVFQKPGFSICFGEPREYFTQYEGTLLKIKDTYQLEADSDEEWCPLNNCIFNIEYDLRHVDSLITNIEKYDESIFENQLRSRKQYKLKN